MAATATVSVDLDETCPVHKKPKSECTSLRLRHKGQKLFTRSGRGSCPKCTGPAHNSHYTETEIQMACLIWATFGAKTFEVNVPNLKKLATMRNEFSPITRKALVEAIPERTLEEAMHAAAGATSKITPVVTPDIKAAPAPAPEAVAAAKKAVDAEKMARIKAALKAAR